MCMFHAWVPSMKPSMSGTSITIIVLCVFVLAAGTLIRSWMKTPYGDLDLRAALLLKFIKVAGIELFKEGETPGESRKTRNESSLLRGRGIRLEAVRNIEIPGPGGIIPLRIYIPRTGPTLPVIVYYHGGGWFTGTLDTHDAICRSLARKTGAVLVAVDFRLAPEHVFPAAVEDAYAALVWVEQNCRTFQGDGTRIVVAGDSSGGNLAAAISILARDAGGPPIRCQALIYPVTDISRMETPSYRHYTRGYYLTKRYMELFRSMYVPDRAQWKDPRVSPLLAGDLRNLPPAIIITAEFDILRDDGEAYAARLAESNVPVVHRRYEGLIHGFMGMDRIFPQSHEAISYIGDELKKYLTGIEGNIE